jgi:hypothetical protein
VIVPVAAEAGTALRALADRASNAVVSVERSAVERARECLAIRGITALHRWLVGGSHGFTSMNVERIHGALVIGEPKGLNQTRQDVKQ